MATKPTCVGITFANAEAAEHFMTWLCEQGEQDYWTWMECREQEEDGDITATNFKYDFMEMNIETKCSRLDKK